jgi:hypothetical protein
MSQVERKKPKLFSRFRRHVAQRSPSLISLPFRIAVPFFWIISLLGAVGVFIAQCFLWLSEGKWVGMSAALLFSYFLPSSSSLVQWLDDPQSWYGTHRLIIGTSLSLFLLLIGGILFCVYAAIPESWARRKDCLESLAFGQVLIVMSICIFLFMSRL